MSIILEGLTKRYDGVAVVNNVSLTIQDGEFFVLLGSSGSGKTTVLNIVAGLTDIDSGRVLLNGRDVTHLPPQERHVGLVFQHYALFEQMTVAENIEFGLRVRRIAPAERRRRRDELLEMVGLAGLGGRLPRQISGGQQQRVALARALAHRPDVLLLDEPLGALDARIRIELRRTLRAVQRELGIATILVTHDQDEAFELADHLGVMSFGRLLEVGEPQTLYGQPQTEFVATFLGAANLLVGQATPNGIQIGPMHLPLNGKRAAIHDARRVQVLFRPEDVAIAAQKEGLECAALGEAVVEETVFSGSLERLRLRLPAISGVRPIAPPLYYGEDALVLAASRTQEQAAALPLRPGKQVWVGVRRIHALEHPGMQFLMLYDGSASARQAIVAGGEIARMAQARITLLVCGHARPALEKLAQEAKDYMGSASGVVETRLDAAPAAQALPIELERRRYDLLVLGVDEPPDLSLAQLLLRYGEHHLLLVRECQSNTRTRPAPAKALICVARGEPGKADVLFAGRLVRHLEAEATLLAVLAETAEDTAQQQGAESFLANGARTLQLLGVRAQTMMRRGAVAGAIATEFREGQHDLLVLGAPLADRDGDILFDGVVAPLLQQVKTFPVLLVRYETGQEALARAKGARR